VIQSTTISMSCSGGDLKLYSLKYVKKVWMFTIGVWFCCYDCSCTFFFIIDFGIEASGKQILEGNYWKRKFWRLWEFIFTS